MKHLLLLSATLVLALSAGAFTTYTETPVKPGASSLVYPVSGKKSKVGGFFGDYRNGGRSHKGVDIYAKKGTAVVAVSDGIITSTATEKLGGKTIRLRSASHSWTAYYAHLDKIHVSVGQQVQKGQAIGTVGTTGNAKRKAAHLHFGIIGGGRAVNPMPYVKKATKISTPVAAAKTKGKSLQLVKDSKTTLPAKAYTTPARSAALRSFMTVSTANNSNPAPLQIWKRMRVYPDAKGAYYVTKNMDVVRVENGNHATVGKWKELNNSNYPNCIILADKTPVYVSREGKLVTPSGEQFGHVN